MIFKVYYQESSTEVPIREKTKTIYIEGENEREIRAKLAQYDYNIEYIQAVEGNYLDYEKQKDDFKVLEI